nr:MAG TPA: hypothetical protein [Caudoviricetes sp.]
MSIVQNTQISGSTRPQNLYNFPIDKCRAVCYN